MTTTDDDIWRLLAELTTKQAALAASQQETDRIFSNRSVANSTMRSHCVSVIAMINLVWGIGDRFFLFFYLIKA
jgi:hypothetical protein